MKHQNLITALEFFIGKVQAMPPGVVFHMQEYDHYVIGQTVGWAFGTDPWDECQTLAKYFGIHVDSRECLFSAEYDGSEFSEVEHSVIKLFTSTIGAEVDRDYWLHRARSKLNELIAA